MSDFDLVICSVTTFCHGCRLCIQRTRGAKWTFDLREIHVKSHVQSLRDKLWTFWRLLFYTLVVFCYMFRKSFGSLNCLSEKSSWISVSGAWAKYFRSFDSIFLAALSKLHSTGNANFFMKNSFLKKHRISIFFRFPTEDFHV